LIISIMRRIKNHNTLAEYDRSGDMTSKYTNYLMTGVSRLTKY